MSAPMIVSTDAALVEELHRLAAAAGVSPDTTPAAEALRWWTTASVVFVGPDAAEELAILAPPRRDAVHVVALTRVEDHMFRTAVDLGATSVVTLPRSEGWVIEALSDLGEAANGVTVGVIGGSGGAGATTFACALGQVASRGGPTMVVDTDPLGPGLDRMVGFERVDGVRWDALQQTTGRLSARSLREALPQREGLGVLTWSPGPAGSLQAFAIRQALEAGRRGHAWVFVDLARRLDPVIEEVTTRCEHVLVVVRPSVAGVAAATRLCARIGSGPQIGLVVRGSGAAPKEVAAVIGHPVLAEMSDQRGLREALDIGAGPVRSSRGPLARAAADVLDRLGTVREAVPA